MPLKHKGRIVVTCARDPSRTRTESVPGCGTTNTASPTCLPSTPDVFHRARDTTDTQFSFVCALSTLGHSAHSRDGGTISQEPPTKDVDGRTAVTPAILEIVLVVGDPTIEPRAANPQREINSVSEDSVAPALCDDVAASVRLIVNKRYSTTITQCQSLHRQEFLTLVVFFLLPHIRRQPTVVTIKHITISKKLKIAVSYLGAALAQSVGISPTTIWLRCELFPWLGGESQ